MVSIIDCISQKTVVTGKYHSEGEGRFLRSTYGPPLMDHQNEANAAHPYDELPLCALGRRKEPQTPIHQEDATALFPSQISACKNPTQAGNAGVPLTGFRDEQCK